MYRTNHNRLQSEMTANPSKYPQGFFADKPCRLCGVVFSPAAPSHLYCSQDCADDASTSAYLQRNYKMSLSDYKGLLLKQNHMCCICNGPGFVMAEHHKLKLVVDHCHTTGQVRGLLCHNCNRALGLFQDNAEFCVRASQYLEGATTISKESTLKRVEAPDTQNG